MRGLGQELGRLARDEEGSSLIFAAITLFSLLLSIMLVYQIGLLTTDRIQLQNAADAVRVIPPNRATVQSAPTERAAERFKRFSRLRERAANNGIPPRGRARARSTPIAGW